MSVLVKVFLVNPFASVPGYAHDGDSGMDLRSMVDVTLLPGVATKIPCGIALGLPDGYEAHIRPRSSFSAAGIHCAFGTIDQGYTGELSAVLTLSGGGVDAGFGSSVEIRVGDRIAQLVIVPIVRAKVELVATAQELGITSRGVGGFGSTGR